jgi:phosphoglycerate kinase
MMLSAASHGDISGRTALVRADFTHGVSREIGKVVAQLTREGARVAVISGFVAPGGDVNPVLSLRRFALPLERMAGTPVTFIPECVGPIAEAGLHRIAFGEAALLENLRFHSDARRDSSNFALRLSALADCFLITGPVPRRPVGWLTALTAILPAPYAQPSLAIEEDR